MKRSSAFFTFTVFIFMWVFVLLSCAEIFAQTTGTFTDTRDNRVYNWVKQGKQTWMAENLKIADTVGSWAYNGDDSVHVSIYGRLYDWKSALKACPKGWHLPSEKDWSRLIESLGPEVAGVTVQSFDTVGKTIEEKEMSNIMPISSLLSGVRYPDGRCLYVTYWGGCWSSTAVNDSMAVNYLFARKTGTIGASTNDKRTGFSVRCIKK